MFVMSGRFGGVRPPAAVFFYSPERKGEHPRAHLERFTGVLHADGYAGFNGLFETGRIVEAGCWAHVRRRFFDFMLQPRRRPPNRRSSGAASSMPSRK